MGVAPASLSSRKLSDKPRMAWQTRMYWHESKRRLEKYVSQRILQEGDGFHLLLRLYALLGGSNEQSSPITVKGGTAAWLYLKQQTVWLSTVLPSASLQVASPVDFDFDSMLSPASTLANSVRAIHSMRQLVDLERFEANCPMWKVRKDNALGESFPLWSRCTLGVSTSLLPIKVTYRGGLAARSDNTEFSLIRLGLALWHRRLARSSVISFIDIAMNKKQTPSTCVFGVRVESPRSMLRTLRGMIFHDVNYQPWLGSDGDYKKQQRRFERLLMISFLEDFKLMSGRVRGVEAAQALMKRWCRVPELVLLAEVDAMRAAANASPQHLRFFLLCTARVCGMVSAPEYDAWLEHTVYPQIVNLCTVVGVPVN